MYSPALYEYCSERSPATTEPEEEEEEEEEDEKEDAAEEEEEEEEEEGVLASRRTASDLKSNVFGVQQTYIPSEMYVELNVITSVSCFRVQSQLRMYDTMSTYCCSKKEKTTVFEKRRSV